MVENLNGLQLCITHIYAQGLLKIPREALGLQVSLTKSWNFKFESTHHDLSFWFYAIFALDLPLAYYGLVKMKKKYTCFQ